MRLRLPGDIIASLRRQSLDLNQCFRIYIRKLNQFFVILRVFWWGGRDSNTATRAL